MRFEWALRDACDDPDFRIHRGDLTVAGDFRSPGFATLILCRLTVGGMVDLGNREEDGFDEGGMFIVGGDMTCRVFSGEFAKNSFVDGDLTATDFLLSGHEDSSLTVLGRLGTRFFYGEDICATVGAGAEMEYGVGCARLLGKDETYFHPLHGEAASRALLFPARMTTRAPPAT